MIKKILLEAFLMKKKSCYAWCLFSRMW